MIPTDLARTPELSRIKRQYHLTEAMYWRKAGDKSMKSFCLDMARRERMNKGEFSLILPNYHSEVFMDLNDFDAPFAADDIEWRIQQSGKTRDGKVWAMVLAYVTNRAIMKRPDDVCGKAGWRNEYRDIPNNGGVECGISIKIDSEWVTKWDAAENTQVEAVKGGRSGAMKRAAVQWGIGRYLYNLEEGFAQISSDKKQGWHRAKLKDGTGFYWLSIAAGLGHASIMQSTITRKYQPEISIG